MTSDVDAGKDPPGLPILGAIPLEDIAPEPASGGRSIVRTLVILIALAGAAYGVHGIVTSAGRVAGDAGDGGALASGDGGASAPEGRRSSRGGSPAQDGDSKAPATSPVPDEGPCAPGSDVRLPPPLLWEGDPTGRALVAQGSPPDGAGLP